MRSSKKFILENSSLIVSFDMKRNGVFSVTDKRNRHRWEEGTTALFTIEFYDVCNDRIRRHEIGRESIKPEMNSLEKLFFQINDEESGIFFRAEFFLNNDILEVRIPIAHLIESKQEQFLLKSIEFNSNGFSVKTGQAGYLLLPNYGGVICRFNRPEARQYRNLIYVPQSQWEDIAILPVFGTVHNDSAYVAIVQEGEFDTEVVTSANWSSNRINSVHPCFNFRYQQNDQIDMVDRRISYNFFAGNDATYAGMAKRYRKYLIETKGLLPLKEKISVSREAQYLYDAYGFIKIFCAVKEKQPDGTSRYKIYTTFPEVVKIMEAFKKKGIVKARFILVGWNCDGHDGRYPTRFPIDQRLGGKEGLLKLIEAAKKLDYQITFHDNYSDAYTSSPDWDNSIVIKDRYGKPVPGAVWAGGQSYFPCPYEATKHFLLRDIPVIKDMGLTGWYYLDGTPRALRGCFDASHGHPLTRRAEAEGIADQFRTVRSYFGGCSVEMPTAFVLGDVDEVAHIPCLGLWTLNPDMKYFIDEQVPFFHIAIHGLIIYHLMDWQHFPALFGSVSAGILKEAEWGAMPRTEVTFRNSDFQGYLKHLPYALKEYKLLCRELGYLQLEFIENHQKIADNVFETTYSDGSIIVVNYNKDEYSYKDKIITGCGVLNTNQ